MRSHIYAQGEMVLAVLNNGYSTGGVRRKGHGPPHPSQEPEIFNKYYFNRGMIS